ncbi:hypothetical protein BCV69DRAFT_310313 [Microstroma glucosiphilum]|uniref:AB hydrolase-1 domain-containing protein n=1 Tax=Pseudomicrostroma glucosiphilum TaxID=1684307 RepID=A0A316UEI4_9BASI|nr:hypothetical protein BCV69DRAFT_310313 [Pseudomicrostroma glucosiphilum]PWN22801.1 hypothetical protein BCV69DRAFT_310313 [Pseudomicrostroma glucosiphilum]
MSAPWRYPTDASCAPVTVSFLAHICSRNFHRRIKCPRTSSSVSYAVVGDLSSKDVVLYCLPSGCSRYLSLFHDGICRIVGVKVIAIDRPGCGATAACPLGSRMHTSRCQTISVLQAEGLIDEHLKLPEGSRPIAILTHSAGFLYALDLLQHFTQLSKSLSSPEAPFASPFGSRPLLLLSSPWVPTSVSRSSLALLPAGVVRLGSTVIPGVGKTLLSAMRGTSEAQGTARSWLSWSFGVVRGTEEEEPRPRTSGSSARPDTPSETERGAADLSAASTPVFTPIPNPFVSSVGLDPPPSPVSRKGQRVRSKAKLRWPKADFLPPHESHHKYTLDSRAYPSDQEDGEGTPVRLLHPATGRPFTLNETSGSRLLFEMMYSESLAGITEDFLLSLGYAPQLNNAQLETLIRERVESLRLQGGADVVCVWAMGDRLIPQRGRDWLDQLLQTEATGGSEEGQETSRGMKYERLIMADAGHDATMTSEAVVVELLRRVKKAKEGEGRES